MPVTVTYRYSFPYRLIPGEGGAFPAISVRLISAHGMVDSLAILDSGAEQSMFDGTLLVPLGLSLLQGKSISLLSLGGPLTAYQHAVEVEVQGHRFPCETCFSSQSIRHNLLGRNFFTYVQVGFRESRLEIYFDPTP